MYSGFIYNCQFCDRVTGATHCNITFMFNHHYYKSDFRLLFHSSNANIYDHQGLRFVNLSIVIGHVSRQQSWTPWLNKTDNMTSDNDHTFLTVTVPQSCYFVGHTEDQTLHHYIPPTPYSSKLLCVLHWIYHQQCNRTVLQTFVISFAFLRDWFSMQVLPLW